MLKVTRLKKITFLFFTLFPVFCFAQKQGQLLIDSLLEQIEHTYNDTLEITTLDRLSYTYSDINPDSGMAAGRKALLLATKIKWMHGIAAACADIGLNYQVTGQHDSALAYQQKAKTIYNYLHEKRGVAAVLQNIALIYTRKGNYALALENNFNALNTFKELDDKNSTAITLENIGTIYLELKNYKKTIEYYTKAININKAIKNLKGVARNMGNMAIVFYNNGEYKKARKYHLAAYEINKALGNKNTMQINLANIGLVYYKENKFQQALAYNLKALEISRETGNKNYIAINMGNIGEIYYALAKTSFEKDNTGQGNENIAQAISYLEQAVSLCKQIHFNAPLTEFIPYLSEAYGQAGDYKRAYLGHKEYVQLKDSIFSLQSAERMATLENKWQSDLREKDMQLKAKQIRLAKLEIMQKKNERILYVLGISLLLLVLTLAIKSMINYQKSNKLLSDEKIAQQKIILSQDNDIKLRNKVLEEIAHMQSHDIRGHVASILGLVQLFNLEDYTDSTNKIIIEGISSSAEKLDEVIKAAVKMQNDLNRGDYSAT